METSPARDTLTALPAEIPAGPPAATAAADLATVNNAFYDNLGERWYEAYDDPVALLRAEGELKNPWVSQRIRSARNAAPGRILDIGCGAGFLANALAAEGHTVSGVDMSRGSLKVAASRAPTPAMYRVADAYRLPYRDASFDAVTALDFLEHVTAPERVIAEAARVLRPGGLFFFHTFNRNYLAWLIVIKGLEWFVRNTPKRMHVLPLFIKPREMSAYCARSGLQTAEMIGMRPRLGRPFWQMLATRRVPNDFKFTFTPSLNISYLGYAKKT
ncbi:MAG: 2-polyprenyl-3-methyl-5-hydroxy-6-metoxy,4-benzoquinol methylase [Fibrobacteres bacterium]|nr:2-polyprenyl-3-methyl-5-hydroxy-6-metoxy,4-benzoquinol methylase [Fibrobacterota bacterium]